MLSGSSLAFAAGAKDYSGYKVYVSLGDSIAAGIGETNRDNKFLYRTPGAYPDIIANEIDAECIPLCCAGSRTVELRACLEDDYVMPDYVTMTMDQAKVDEIRGAFAPAIKKADLITLNIGANDVATYALLLAKDYAGKLGINIASANSAVSEYEAEGDITSAVTSLVSLADKVGAAADMVKAIINGLRIGAERFCENWDAIIRDIYKLNPDVTLMVAGLYNPFNHVKLSGSATLEIGRALDGVIDMINSKMQYGSIYACRYIYVDINGIESLFAAKNLNILDKGFLSDPVLDVHPSVKGQAQIAERFIDKIPEKHACTAPFIDISKLEDEFKAAIEWAYNVGVSIGKDAGLFDPDGCCTRGEIITMLWRAAGCPTPKSSGCAFADVDPRSYCAKAVEWAYEQGIALGYSKDEFAPSDICTRAQIVTFLSRSAGAPKTDGGVSFTDVRAGDYFFSAVAWAVNNHIAKGFDSQHFAPNAACTRAQAAAFLFRCFG